MGVRGEIDVSIARVTEYTVAALGDDPSNPDWHVWMLTVAWRDVGRWAVCWGGRCLGADGVWDHERSPSNREDDWRETHRFPLEEALRLAEEKVWELRINGKTAAEVIRGYYPELTERIPEHVR